MLQMSYKGGQDETRVFQSPDRGGGSVLRNLYPAAGGVAMPIINKQFYMRDEVKARADLAHLTELCFCWTWREYRKLGGDVMRRVARSDLAELRLARLCQKWEAENG